MNKTKIVEFEVSIPNLEGTEVAERVKVPVTMDWDDELEVWVLTKEAHDKIENTKARRMGLLLPVQLKTLRERFDFTQKEMGELFQVGEKSWTRWESGKHRPSRCINLLVQALYEDEISIKYLLSKSGKLPKPTEINRDIKCGDWSSSFNFDWTQIVTPFNPQSALNLITANTIPQLIVESILQKDSRLSENWEQRQINCLKIKAPQESEDFATAA